MKDPFNKNIKILAVFFTVCFLSIIAYLAFFDITEGNKVMSDPMNKRLQDQEKEITRGSIFDRNGKVLAYSTKNSDGTSTRFYPDGKKFAHLIGYTSTIYGKTGVEKGYNKELQGVDKGEHPVEYLFRSIRQAVNGEDKKGNNVYLTIDAKLQNIAYDALGNNRGGIVAINPQTGEILADVSKPSFDPQNIDQNFKQYNSDNLNTPLVNRANSGYYPPGSTFKIITAASALENIAGIEKRSFFCDGRLRIGNYILRDHNGTAHGREDLKKSFMVSCNNTFGKLGIELGGSALKTTAGDFLFNQDINNNDENDVLHIRSGSLAIDASDTKAMLAQDAIGQNKAAANPMVMALVAASIGGGGRLMKPYAVREVSDCYGFSLSKTTPALLAKTVSPEIAEKIKSYMIGVVAGGTGVNASIKGITVAGKTGTAEDGNKTHAWFTAFAPAEHPTIAVAVIIENGGQGGRKAAVAAKAVMKQYFGK